MYVIELQVSGYRLESGLLGPEPDCPSPDLSYTLYAKGSFYCPLVGGRIGFDDRKQAFHLKSLKVAKALAQLVEEDTRLLPNKPSWVRAKVVEAGDYSEGARLDARYRELLAG